MPKASLQSPDAKNCHMKPPARRDQPYRFSRTIAMAIKARIGVLGASGYTGSELVRLLLRHPRAELALLTADRRAGQEMRDGVSAVRAVRACRNWSPSTIVDWLDAESRPDLLRAAARHDAEGHQVDHGRRALDADRRPVRRLPPGGHRRLCEMVRPCASRAGTAEVRLSTA